MDFLLHCRYMAWVPCYLPFGERAKTPGSLLPFSILFLLIFSFVQDLESAPCGKEKKEMDYCRGLARRKGYRFKSHCRTRIRNHKACTTGQSGPPSQGSKKGTRAESKAKKRVQVRKGNWGERKSHKSHGPRGSTSLAGIKIIGSAARFNTQDCLPKKAPSVIRTIQAMRKMGWEVTISSGYRPTRYNNALIRKGRGAVKGSYHTKCRATDIRVRGASRGTVTKWLKKNRPGGLGVYCSFWHIDNGRKRQWGSCRGKKRRPRKYKRRPKGKASSDQMKKTSVSR